MFSLMFSNSLGSRQFNSYSLIPSCIPHFLMISSPDAALNTPRLIYIDSMRGLRLYRLILHLHSPISRDRLFGISSRSAPFTILHNDTCTMSRRTDFFFFIADCRTLIIQ